MTNELWVQGNEAVAEISTPSGAAHARIPLHLYAGERDPIERAEKIACLSLKLGVASGDDWFGCTRKYELELLHQQQHSCVRFHSRAAALRRPLYPRQGQRS